MKIVHMIFFDFITVSNISIPIIGQENFGQEKLFCWWYHFQLAFLQNTRHFYSLRQGKILLNQNF